jgi:hypothetical protein
VIAQKAITVVLVATLQTAEPTPARASESELASARFGHDDDFWAVGGGDGR